MAWLQFSFQIFPEFLVGIVFILFSTILFSGVLLSLYKTKIGWFELSLSAYAGLSAFILLNYLLWYLMDLRIALSMVSFLMGASSIYGWWHSRKLLDLQFSKLFFVVALITVLLSFFVFKFTYHNGLHDEYFHYAALNLFNHTGQYPFLHPYDFDHSLNEVYHIGSYFVVIAINAFPFFDLEQALDVTKLAIFFPFPIFLFHALKKIFTNSPNWLILFSVPAVLLTGPSWFLRDSFTQWLTNGADLPQIYMPLLYDLAGVTWSGILFWIVLTLVLVLPNTQNLIKSSPSLISMGLLFLATMLVNRAYMLTNVISALALGKFLIRSRSSKYQNFERLFIPGVLIAVVLAVVFLFYFQATDLIRESSAWGYPYATNLYSDGIQVEHGFMKVTDPRFFFTFGAAPLYILLSSFLIAKIFHKQSPGIQHVLWLFVVFAFLMPVGVYMISDNGLGLALNKLLRPAEFFVALIPLLLFEVRQKTFSYIALVLITIGMISPVRFFIVNVGSGLQQFWIEDSSDVMETAAFIENNNYTKIVVPEWGVAYKFSNLLPIQSYACITCTDYMAPILVLPNNPGYIDQYSKLETAFENNSYVVKEF